MTNYYNINTNDCSKYWDTNIIIQFLNDSNKFIYNGNGIFNCKNEYCLITLVYANNFNSFLSPNDFNNCRTNYIDIITSCEISNELMKLLQKLAYYLKTELVEEE